MPLRVRTSTGDVLTLDEERVAIGTAEVALAERRALEQLASLGQVLVRKVDVSARLEDQQLGRSRRAAIDASCCSG